jgi:flagellar basal body-associated protein FliL
MPGNVPSSSLPTQPMTTMSRQDAQALVQSQVAQAQPAKSGSLGRTLMIASLVVILLCGLVIAAVLFLKNGGASSASQPPVTFVPSAAATLIADLA